MLLDVGVGGVFVGGDVGGGVLSLGYAGLVDGVVVVVAGFDECGGFFGEDGDVESVVGEGPVLDVGAWVVAFGFAGVELAAAFLVDDVDP